MGINIPVNKLIKLDMILILITLDVKKEFGSILFFEHTNAANTDTFIVVSFIFSSIFPNQITNSSYMGAQK